MFGESRGSMDEICWRELWLIQYRRRALVTFLGPYVGVDRRGKDSLHPRTVAGFSPRSSKLQKVINQSIHVHLCSSTSFPPWPVIYFSWIISRLDQSACMRPGALVIFFLHIEILLHVSIGKNLGD
jgi:hypothetical protein